MKLSSWCKRNEPEHLGNSQENIQLKAVSDNVGSPPAAVVEMNSVPNQIPNPSETLLNEETGSEPIFTPVTQAVSSDGQEISEQMMLEVPEVAESVSIDTRYSSYDGRHSPGSCFSFEYLHLIISK